MFKYKVVRIEGMNKVMRTLDGKMYKLDIDEITDICGWMRWSEYDLAVYSGFALITIRRWLTGKEQPRLDSLERLAKTLDCEPEGIIKECYYDYEYSYSKAVEEFDSNNGETLRRWESVSDCARSLKTSNSTIVNRIEREYIKGNVGYRFG